MDQTRLKARVSNYFRKMKLPNIWFTETGKDRDKLQIKYEDIEGRGLLRKN